MGHKIDLNDIPDTIQVDFPLARAEGRDEDKDLRAEFTCVLGGKSGVRFVVRDHRTEVFRSEDLERAVEAYNAH
jgi:hypothetical protein